MPFPCFHQRQGRDIALAELPSSIVRELAEVCREAWHGGMLAGCNGNASCRWQSPEGERIVITRSGAAKGRLTLQDLCVLDARSGATLYGGPSSRASCIWKSMRPGPSAGLSCTRIPGSCWPWP